MKMLQAATIDVVLSAKTLTPPMCVVSINDIQNDRKGIENTLPQSI